ncbi:MAG: PIN domain-containing protein [Candidatus Binataceae bacterium]
MIVFFDSNVHIGLLLGKLTWRTVAAEIGTSPVRLSPVVASELLRGATGRSARVVERLVAEILPLEPPSWRSCWIETGRLLPRIFRDHEAIGLARLQNDCLLALSARHTGAAFVTGDSHFQSIRRRVPFRLIMLPPQKLSGL